MEDAIDVKLYLDKYNKHPFEEWLTTLTDEKAKAAIVGRLNRVRHGNFGDCKSVGKGIHELRIWTGKGYRVYFGKESGKEIIILSGGHKDTQVRDVKKAYKYWADYKKG